MIDWLLEGDASIKRIVKEDLLDEEAVYTEAGYIEKYLSFYDKEKRMFGGGLYSPKWVSTFYTCLELTNLRITPSNPIFQESCDHLYQTLWVENRIYKHQDKRDVCIVGMLLKMLSYQKRDETDYIDIVQFLIDTQMQDGGWNCRYHNKEKPKTSSVHTTLSVLEGFAMYIKQGYTFQANKILKIRELAHEFLLKKELFRSRRTKEIIHKEMMQFHYPHRWKYDCYRALDYFQSIQFPYDVRMKEALDNLKSALDKGYINRGKQYNGKVFFHLETGKKGRFTTLEALRILKFYDPASYQFIITKNVSYK